MTTPDEKLDSVLNSLEVIKQENADSQKRLKAKTGETGERYVFGPRESDLMGGEAA